MKGEQIKQAKINARLGALHNKVLILVEQYYAGLVTVAEFFECADELNYEMDGINLSNVADPNTGLRYPEDM